MYALVHRPAPIIWSNIFRPIFPQLFNTIRNKEAALLPLHGVREEKIEEIILDEKVDTTLPTPPLSPGASVTSLALSTVSTIPPLPMLTTPTYRVDLSNNIFNYDCGFPQYTYEGSVPYAATGECLKDLEEWCVGELHDPKGLRSHFPIEIRFVEKDEIWLSPTYGGRGTYIGAIQYRCVLLFLSHFTMHSNRTELTERANEKKSAVPSIFPFLTKFSSTPLKLIYSLTVVDPTGLNPIPVPERN